MEVSWRRRRQNIPDVFYRIALKKAQIGAELKRVDGFERQQERKIDKI